MQESRVCWHWVRSLWCLDWHCSVFCLCVTSHCMLHWSAGLPCLGHMLLQARKTASVFFWHCWKSLSRVLVHWLYWFVHPVLHCCTYDGDASTGATRRTSMT